MGIVNYRRKLQSIIIVKKAFSKKLDNCERVNTLFGCPIKQICFFINCELWQKLKSVLQRQNPVWKKLYCGINSIAYIVI